MSSCSDIFCPPAAPEELLPKSICDMGRAWATGGAMRCVYALRTLHTSCLQGITRCLMDVLIKLMTSFQCPVIFPAVGLNCITRAIARIHKHIQCIHNPISIIACTRDILYDGRKAARQGLYCAGQARIWRVWCRMEGPRHQHGQALRNQGDRPHVSR